VRSMARFRASHGCITGARFQKKAKLKCLKKCTYWIPDALPGKSSASTEADPRDNSLRPGLYVCGDHRETASIHSALASGRKTPEAVCEAMRKTEG